MADSCIQTGLHVSHIFSSFQRIVYEKQKRPLYKQSLLIDTPGENEGRGERKRIGRREGGMEKIKEDRGRKEKVKKQKQIKRYK